MTPQVSAVISTCKRPQLVGRAVASALTQTLREIEVIVVLDGPDPATLAVLEGIDDARLRVHVRDRQGGQSAAINDGVRLAQGAWLATLDDDDEWMPAKLEEQLRTASASRWSNPVVGCRFLARSELGEAVWPLRLPRPREPVCEYLFCRSQLAFGEGILPTSTFFAPTELFRRYPMAEDLYIHNDLDWMVRVAQASGAGLEMLPHTAPLAVWQMQAGRDRLSNVHDWRFSFNWMARSRPLVSPRAYAGFLLTWVSLSARLQRDLTAFPFLLREALRHGRPGLLEMAVYGSVWGLPPGLRARLSRALT